jgi:hypothetical protein
LRNLTGGKPVRAITGECVALVTPFVNLGEVV